MCTLRCDQRRVKATRHRRHALNIQPRHLRGWGGFSVAGHHPEGDSPAAVLQQLLQLPGVATHHMAVHLEDDVTRVQHALPVDGAAVQDPRDHRLAALHTKCHTLR